MITRDEILDSIKYVVDNSKYVKLNNSKINKITNILKNNKKTAWLNNNFLDVNNYSDDKIILYLILCESLNFCYWDCSTKWKIEYNGNWYSGSYGLFYSISKAIRNGYNLLDINYLENITLEEFDNIFKGSTSIPLLKERFKVLKQVVSELKKINNLKELFNVDSDIKLLNIIIDNFSNFRDISIYKGRKIYIFKRANLLVSDLILNVDYIKNNIKNFDNLTGCADYKIPQVLRQIGVLEYASELENLIDSKKEIDHDCEMEIEIRANMLYALELIKEKLHNKGINMNSVQIDNSLWLLSKNKEFKSKPYHLSKTIYY